MVDWTALPVQPGYAPMEARLAAALPDGTGWQFEPKWDGFRALAFRAGGAVELMSKSGKSLARFFPEMIERLASLKAERFVLDGELFVPIAGALAFDALQARLHPAESRIRKLAAETPAQFILFDMLAGPDGASLLDAPLTERMQQASNSSDPGLRISVLDAENHRLRGLLIEVHAAVEARANDPAALSLNRRIWQFLEATEAKRAPRE